MSSVSSLSCSPLDVAPPFITTCRETFHLKAVPGYFSLQQKHFPPKLFVILLRDKNCAFFTYQCSQICGVLKWNSQQVCAALVTTCVFWERRNISHVSQRLKYNILRKKKNWDPQHLAEGQKLCFWARERHNELPSQVKTMTSKCHHYGRKWADSTLTLCSPNLVTTPFHASPCDTADLDPDCLSWKIILKIIVRMNQTTTFLKHRKV